METIDKRAILKDHMARGSRYLARCSKDVQKMTEIAVSPDEASMSTTLAVQLTAQSHGYHPANHFWPDGNDWVLGDTIDSQVRRAYLATILAKVGLTEEKLAKKVGLTFATWKSSSATSADAIYQTGHGGPTASPFS